MEGRFVLLLRKSFHCYRCDAAIDAAGNAIVDAGGGASGVAARVRLILRRGCQVVQDGSSCGYDHDVRWL